MRNNEILQQIRGGLIVSCQALPHEPLHGASVMAKMATAALQGGAAGIRANTVRDIKAIQAAVSLPVIGIIKQEYTDSSVYITPTMKEVNALAACGVGIIATDATSRPRPRGENLATFFQKARAAHPDMLFMADCATLDEAVAAADMGFDIVATTLSGYTPDTKGAPAPDFPLLAAMHTRIQLPIIAEGGIHTPNQAAEALHLGAFAVVVGGAITRPQEITKRFTAAIRAGQ